jgi:hypothetical protein
MTAEIIPFPKKIVPVEEPPVDPSTGKVTTLIISDGVYSMPASMFKWPSAGPVDSRYAKALEEQKKKRNG